MEHQPEQGHPSAHTQASWPLPRSCTWAGPRVLAYFTICENFPVIQFSSLQYYELHQIKKIQMNILKKEKGKLYILLIIQIPLE